MRVFSFLFFAAGTNAALPPGYEDFMWCPPDNCRFDTNQPYGLVGPASTFNKCKNLIGGKTTLYVLCSLLISAALHWGLWFLIELLSFHKGEITNGIWTGNLTDVTVPEGWIEPQECNVGSNCTYLFSVSVVIFTLFVCLSSELLAEQCIF